MGQCDTWLSSTLRGKDGRSIPGVTYEPTRYRLEVTLGDKAQRLEGIAPIDLEPVLANPPRLVTLALHSDTGPAV